jgi:hypothetical protein
MDSILKNIGGPYVPTFARHIVALFSNAYQRVSPTVRNNLIRTRKTWDRIFPPVKLQLIDSEVKSIVDCEHSAGRKQAHPVHAAPPPHPTPGDISPPPHLRPPSSQQQQQQQQQQHAPPHSSNIRSPPHRQSRPAPLPHSQAVPQSTVSVCAQVCAQVYKCVNFRFSP